MYLIHLALGSDADHPLPREAVAWLRASAHPDEGIEHVVVHNRPFGGSVLGVYVLAPRLAEAERHAVAVFERAREDWPALARWYLKDCQAPLVPHFYDRMLAASPPPGRNGPGPIPST